MENIISSLSIRVIHSFSVRHDSAWAEHRTKVDYTVWCVTEGNIYIKIDGREYRASKGDAVLFYPGVCYDAHTDENGCAFSFVRFTLEMGSRVDLLAGLNLSGIARGISDATLSFARDYMQNQVFLRRTSFKRYLMFANYIDTVIDSLKSDRAVLFYQRAHTVERTTVQTAIDYISRNYGRITIGDVARHVHLSEKRFISVFKKTVDISPGQYIHQCKMKRAAELLSDTNMKIADIAAILDFSDQYSFSKSFKRSFGESPTEFRKSIM